MDNKEAKSVDARVVVRCAAEVTHVLDHLQHMISESRKHAKEEDEDPRELAVGVPIALVEHMAEILVEALTRMGEGVGVDFIAAKKKHEEMMAVADDPMEMIKHVLAALMGGGGNVRVQQVSLDEMFKDIQGAASEDTSPPPGSKLH